jgi:hypothetical protein
MIEREDNPLANVELATISAPRAPAGFAEGVLARFATTEAAIAVARRRRMRRAAWIAAGTLAAAAAVLALVLWWPARGPETGAFAAVVPRHLDVGGLAVDLEGGTTIAWTREHDRLHVDQRGSATWSVPPGHDLRVEVAGIGTVDATNATLHVEARMNLLDSKLIGVTAATAALVTAVTVTVIHGQAHVGGAGTSMTVKAGHSVVVSAGKQPVELITANKEPAAVEIVFSGEARWTARELEVMENAIDHIQLATGSTIGAVSYATVATLRAEATPKSRFMAAGLGDVSLYRDGVGSDVISGLKLGLAELKKSNAARKTLVLIDDGNDTDNDNSAKLGMLGLAVEAQKAGVLFHTVLAPGKVELTHALADAMGGTLEPPKAVMVVFEGRGAWLNADVLDAIGQGIADMNLPPGSRIGAIDFFEGAEIRIALEPARSFKADQLGTANDYAAKVGSDLVQGVMMGLAELAHAPETDKVLIVIGDGHDTNDSAAPMMVTDLVAQAHKRNVRIRALQYGSVDPLLGSLLKRLDPNLVQLAGAGYRDPLRLNGLQVGVRDSAGD